MKCRGNQPMLRTFLVRALSFYTEIMLSHCIDIGIFCQLTRHHAFTQPAKISR